MTSQYIITVDVDMNDSDDPAMLSTQLVDQVTECALAIPGITGCKVVGVA